MCSCSYLPFLSRCSLSFSLSPSRQMFAGHGRLHMCDVGCPHAWCDMRHLGEPYKIVNIFFRNKKKVSFFLFSKDKFFKTYFYNNLIKYVFIIFVLKNQKNRAERQDQTALTLPLPYGHNGLNKDIYPVLLLGIVSTPMQTPAYGEECVSLQAFYLLPVIGILGTAQVSACFAVSENFSTHYMSFTVGVLLRQDTTIL